MTDPKPFNPDEELAKALTPPPPETLEEYEERYGLPQPLVTGEDAEAVGRAIVDAIKGQGRVSYGGPGAIPMPARTPEMLDWVWETGDDPMWQTIRAAASGYPEAMGNRFFRSAVELGLAVPMVPGQAGPMTSQELAKQYIANQDPRVQRIIRNTDLIPISDYWRGREGSPARTMHEITATFAPFLTGWALGNLSIRALTNLDPKRISTMMAFAADGAIMGDMFDALAAETQPGAESMSPILQEAINFGQRKLGFDQTLFPDIFQYKELSPDATDEEAQRIEWHNKRATALDMLSVIAAGAGAVGAVIGGYRGTQRMKDFLADEKNQEAFAQFTNNLIEQAGDASFRLGQTDAVKTIRAIRQTLREENPVLKKYMSRALRPISDAAYKALSTSTGQRFYQRAKYYRQEKSPTQARADNLQDWFDFDEVDEPAHQRPKIRKDLSRSFGPERAYRLFEEMSAHDWESATENLDRQLAKRHKTRRSWGLTDQEMILLMHYFGPGSFDINGQIRRGEPSQSAEIISHALRRMPEQFHAAGQTVWRHASSNWYRHWKPGAIVKEKALTSTSARPFHMLNEMAASMIDEYEQVQIVIETLPEGSQGRRLTFSAFEDQEAEVLFPENSYFEVVNVDYWPSGKPQVITAREIHELDAYEKMPGRTMKRLGVGVAAGGAATLKGDVADVAEPDPMDEPDVAEFLENLMALGFEEEEALRLARMYAERSVSEVYE